MAHVYDSHSDDTTPLPDAASLRTKAAEYEDKATAANDGGTYRSYRSLAKQFRDAADAVETVPFIAKSAFDVSVALGHATHYDKLAEHASHPDTQRIYAELAERYRTKANDIHEADKAADAQRRLDDATETVKTARPTPGVIRAGRFTYKSPEARAAEVARRTPDRTPVKITSADVRHVLGMPDGTKAVTADVTKLVEAEVTKAVNDVLAPKVADMDRRLDNVIAANSAATAPVRRADPTKSAHARRTAERDRLLAIADDARDPEVKRAYRELAAGYDDGPEAA